MPDAVQTFAGSTIAISNALPTTYDDDGSTGFPSLSFTTVGEVTDVGSFGRQYNLVTHLPINSREVEKLKGSYNNGSLTFSMARDDDDAGQVICLAGLAADASYSFKITYQDNTVDYFSAKIMSYQSVAGGSDSIVMRQMQLEVDSDVVTA